MAKYHFITFQRLDLLECFGFPVEHSGLIAYHFLTVSQYSAQVPFLFLPTQVINSCLLMIDYIT